MDLSLGFNPLLGWTPIGALGLAAAAMLGLAIWRRLPGWGLRALAFALVLTALAGPQLQRETREGLTNIAFLVVDRSESTGLEDRAAQIEAAKTTLTARITALSTPETPVELRVVDVLPDTSGTNLGSRVLTALDEAAARVAPAQIAGAVLLTDGQIHDASRLADFPAPVHALIAGEKSGFDMKLELGNAPKFGIVGTPVLLGVTARAQGRVPPGVGAAVTADLSIDGGAPRPVILHLGTETQIEVPITHGGPNVVDLRLLPRPGELTDRNNRILTTISGVRDRLRVLLVSGEPHPGGRTWRDLLKSDPAVDLIHFTILRPPAKQDGTPVSELSLIAFPTRELFMEKIGGFDLIVFDRYRWGGVLAASYLDNIAKYVREGGAVLVSSGPAFAGAQSLARTPLGAVLPAQPTLQVLEQPFLPRVTDLGQRHPVTAGLEQSVGIGPDGPRWGRWLRQIEVLPDRGSTVMSGANGLPLMILDRVDQGRVALITSDHAWLWTRGYEGGGPQADLLRRTAHWLMKEPELEEEALFATVLGTTVTVERRTLADTAPDVVTAEPPEGAAARELSLTQTGPGRYRATLDNAEQGLWRFTEGELSVVAAVGPPAPAEYTNPLADPGPLTPLVTASGGRVAWLGDGVPDVRLVEPDRRASAQRWIGLVARDAHRTTGVSLTPLMPGWLAALAIGLTLLAAWWREAR